MEQAVSPFGFSELPAVPPDEEESQVPRQGGGEEGGTETRPPSEVGKGG